MWRDWNAEEDVAVNVDHRWGWATCDQATGKHGEPAWVVARAYTNPRHANGDWYYL